MYTVTATKKGLDFARAAIAVALSKTPSDAVSIAEIRWGAESASHRYTRAAVAAGNTLGTAWGADVAAAGSQQEFFAYTQQQMIIGRLTGKVEMPLNVRMLTVTNGATAHWVGQGAPKPISKLQLAGQTLEPLKTCSLVVLTKETLEFSSPQTEARVLADLQRATIELGDSSFIDPNNAGIAGVSPAAITNGATPIASSGSPAPDVATLVEALEGDLSSSYFISDPLTFAQMALWRDASGYAPFADLGPRGGSIMGIPALASRSSPRDSNGGILVLLDASAVAYGAEGVRIARSEHATLQMDSEPDSPVTAATTMISLWQNNLVALLVELSQNWKLAKPSAVAVITGADYGQLP